MNSYSGHETKQSQHGIFQPQLLPLLTPQVTAIPTASPCFISIFIQYYNHVLILLFINTFHSATE